MAHADSVSLCRHALRKDAEIADQLGVSPDRTITMLTGGLRNEHMVDVYDESGDEQSQLFRQQESPKHIPYNCPGM